MSASCFGSGALTAKYDEALQLASEAHRNQMRKSGQVPYLSHLLRVSGLALDYGASEDVAIAALLHDVVEDCGGLSRAEEIRAKFGDFIAGVVLETSDSTTADPDKKAPWKERKEKYVDRLKTESDAAALIAACDKLDNVTSLTRYLTTTNDFSILLKFKGGRAGEFWYWDSIVDVLKERKIPAAVELERAVENLRKIWKD